MEWFQSGITQWHLFTGMSYFHTALMCVTHLYDEVLILWSKSESLYWESICAGLMSESSFWALCNCMKQSCIWSRIHFRPWPGTQHLHHCPVGDWFTHDDPALLMQWIFHWVIALDIGIMHILWELILAFMIQDSKMMCIYTSPYTLLPDHLRPYFALY